MRLVPRKLFIEWTFGVKQAVGESALPRKLIIQWASVVKQADCEAVAEILPRKLISAATSGAKLPERGLILPRNLS